jgi:hypothetical protein
MSSLANTEGARMREDKLMLGIACYASNNSSDAEQRPKIGDPMWCIGWPQLIAPFLWNDSKSLLGGFFTELRGRIITSLDIGFIFRTGGLQRGGLLLVRRREVSLPPRNIEVGTTRTQGPCQKQAEASRLHLFQLPAEIAMCRIRKTS